MSRTEFLTLLKPAVVQLIDSFHQGGSERQAVQLTRLLHEGGRFKVRVACLNAEGVLRPDIERLGLGEIPAFPLNSFYDANAMRQLRRFRSWLKSEEIDILHAHDFYTNIFGVTGGVLARVPVRIASRRETSGMRTGAQARAQQFAYSLAHQIVANSSAVKDKLIEEGNAKEKVALVPNGLDVARLEPAKKLTRAETLALLGLPANVQAKKFVTIVANMRHDVKDYPMFLRSAQRVRESVADASFLLAGEGELMPSLKDLAASLGLGEHTYFLGRCERVAELLSISDVCVLSSKAEGFSNSILEYMAAARPVVATDVGGAREAVVEGETGYLVESGDDAMMAERIVSLLTQPDRATAMGREGRRLVEKEYSCEAQLRRTEELYERLLASNARR